MVDLVAICTRKCTQELFDVSHKLRTNRRKTTEVELAILLEDKKKKSTTAAISEHYTRLLI